MSGPPIRQTLYARISWSHTPSFPLIFPFWGPNAQEMYVVNAAGRSVQALAQVAVVELIIEIGAFIGPRGSIASAVVQLLEAGGVDSVPDTRLFSPPTIIPRNGRPRQAVRQLFSSLQADGQYIAWASVITGTGRSTYVAPFVVGAGDQTFGYILDDDGSAILADDRTGGLLLTG